MRIPSDTPIPTPQALAPHVAAGHVAAKRTGDLTVYNYTKRCIFERAWNPVTLQARGLVYADDGRRLAVPLPKFFNHDEPDAELPDTAPDGVTVKYDGSLGISFVHEGQVRWTTRGTLGSPQARVADALWARDHGARAHAYPAGWTLLVEIVHADTKVIADHDFDGLVLLEARHVDSGAYMPPDQLDAVAADLALRRPEAGPDSVDALVAALAQLPSTAEGWVARWGDHRLKFKGSAYMAVARLVQGLQPRRVADLWFHRALAPMLPTIPEEIRQQIGDEVATLEEDAETYASRVRRAVARVAPMDDAAAAAALRASDPELLADALRARRGKPFDPRLGAYRLRFEGKRPRAP
jgi:RNA ligase